MTKQIKKWLRFGIFRRIRLFELERTDYSWMIPIILEMSKLKEVKQQ